MLLNIFPSVDTPVCATSVRTADERAAAKWRYRAVCLEGSAVRPALLQRRGHRSVMPASHSGTASRRGLRRDHADGPALSGRPRNRGDRADDGVAYGNWCRKCAEPS